MITFKPGRYFVGMWYVDVDARLHPPKGGNVMGAVWRDEAAPNVWHIQYRHRYYLDEGMRPWELMKSKDRFCWYEGTITGSEEKAVEVMSQFFEHLRTAAGMVGGEIGEVEFLAIAGGPEELHAITLSDKCPRWLNFVQMPTEVAG